jgi:hypothetical protein
MGRIDVDKAGRDMLEAAAESGERRNFKLSGGGGDTFLTGKVRRARGQPGYVLETGR